MKITRSLPLYAACTVALAISSGCTKGSESGSSSVLSTKSAEISPLRDHALLNYLPSSSMGYYLTDFTLESAKKYGASALGAESTMVGDNLRKLASGSEEDENAKQLSALVEELEASGLIPSEKSKGQLNSFLTSFSIESKQGAPSTPSIVIFEEFASPQNVAAQVTALQKAVEAKGTKTKPFAVEGGSGFSTELTLGEGEDKTVKVPLIFAAKGGRLIASTTPALVDVDFLNGAASKSTRFAELKNDADYKRALESVPAHRTEFASSFIDTKRLLKAVAGVSPELEASRAEIEKLPLGAGFLAREMDQALVDRGSVIFASDTQGANPAITELQKVSASSFATQFPAGLVGFISLDGAIAKAIIGSMAEKDKTPEIQPMLETALSVEEIGIALRPQQGASPLPELVLVLQSSKSAELAQMISAAITAGASSQGFLSPFQKKEIQGVTVDYALSPFGAGVYVAASGNQVILSTSEPIISEVIAGAKENSGKALEAMSTESKEVINSKGSLVLAHVDYTKVTGLIQGLSASLGIFTGGKPLVEDKELERINSYGQTSAVVSVVDSSIRFTTRTEPLAKKAG